MYGFSSISLLKDFFYTAQQKRLQDAVELTAKVRVALTLSLPEKQRGTISFYNIILMYYEHIWQLGRYVQGVE